MTNPVVFFLAISAANTGSLWAHRNKTATICHQKQLKLVKADSKMCLSATSSTFMTGLVGVARDNIIRHVKVLIYSKQLVLYYKELAAV